MAAMAEDVTGKGGPDAASKLDGKLLLRVNEVAYLLGLSRSEIYKLISCSDLPAIRIGRSVRVSRATLELWIADRERACR